MREIEARATRDFGISEAVMMENAGRSVAGAVRSFFRSRCISKDKSICIFCGSGNNGGDGFVAARHLSNKGYYPEIILLKPPESLRGISLVNFTAAEKAGIPVSVFGPGCKMHGCGLVIDSLLGTGTEGGVREPYLSAIKWINNSKLPVVAVDIPSGICADTGDILTAAVKADITVTMGAAKQGLVLEKARKYVGDIIIADIGIPKIILP